MQQRPIRMDIGEILDQSLRLVQQNFFLFTGLVAILQVPLSLLYTLLVNGLIAQDLQNNAQRLQDATQHTQNGTVNSTAVLKALLGVSRDSVFLLILFLLLSLVVTGLIGGIVSLAVAERFSGRPTSIGRCFAQGMRRLPPLLGVLVLRSLLLTAPIALPLAAIVQASGNLIDELPTADLATTNLSPAATHDLGVFGIALVVLMLLALIDVFLYVRWALCPQVAMLERRGLSSLGRSSHLVGGAWWKSFGVLLIGFLIVSVASRLVTAVDSRILDAIHLDGNARTITQWVIDTLVTVITLPVALSMQTLLFFDLKARHEGFDQAVLAGELDAASAP